MHASTLEIRLEQATKAYDQAILASEAIVAAAGASAEWCQIGHERLPGRNEPLAIHTSAAR